MITKNNNKGFSLVELSVSLVIIGIVFLAVMSSLRSISANMSAVKTDEKLDKAVEAVMDLTLSEPTTSQAFSTNEYQLPKADEFNKNFVETDGYGNSFTYRPANNILKGSANKICEVADTDLSIKFNNKNGTYRIINNVAFVITGNGPDLTKDTTNSGNTLIINTDNDDQYKYVSLFEFKLDIECPTVQAFNIINEELPQITANVKNLIFASGSIDTQKKWCVAVLNANQQTIIKEGLTFNVVGDSPDDLQNINPKPNGSLTIQATDNGCNDDGNYKQGKALIVEKKSGTSPYYSGSYKFTVHVKDSSGLTSSRKSFVQTVYRQ